MDKDEIQERLLRIKELALGYFPMQKGDLIDKFQETLRIFDILVDTPNNPHPHFHHRVYISRRALKHFVESRKADLMVRHSEDETMGILCGMLEVIPDIILYFDVYTLENGTHYYIKYYPGQPSIKIGCDWKPSVLEIKTIHFVKQEGRTLKNQP